MSELSELPVTPEASTTQKSKEEEEKENINVTIKLADDIYKVMQDKRMKEISPDDRHKILLQKYKNFADMYPVVLRFLARDIRYNRVAFKRMLEKLLQDQKFNAQKNSNNKKKRDPLEAMKAFITHQADYAKFLYLEESKRTGRHMDMRKASAIWRVEYDNMNKALKKIKDDEDKVRNEFEEEKKIHLDERRKELLNFIMEERTGEAGDTETTKTTETTENTENTETTDNAGHTGSSEEEKEKEKELDELSELDNYIGDLKEAYAGFTKEDIMPGIENSDLEEYGYVLNYCKRLFDLAVKHNKMTDDDKKTLDEEITYCLQVIEDEFERRRKIGMELKKERDEEWIKDLIPKKPGQTKSNKTKKVQKKKPQKKK